MVSFPVVIIGIFGLLNPSACTMVQDSTHSLTGTSTMNISLGAGGGGGQMRPMPETFAALRAWSNLTKDSFYLIHTIGLFVS